MSDNQTIEGMPDFTRGGPLPDAGFGTAKLLTYKDLAEYAEAFDRIIAEKRKETMPEIIEVSWMQPGHPIVFCGNKAYVWPDFQLSEGLRAIQIPEYTPDPFRLISQIRMNDEYQTWYLRGMDHNPW